MAYVDSTIATGTSNTISVAVPTGVQADDIVIIGFGLDNQSAAVNAGDPPTSFTELAENDNTLDGHTSWIGWKRLTGADSGTYSFGNVDNSGQAWVCVAVAFRGRDTTNPPVVGTTGSSNAANGNPVSVNAPGVTAVDGDDLLWFGSADVNATGIGNGYTAPSGYIEAEDGELTFSDVSIAYKENVSAGATGTVTGTLALTSGGSGWTSWLVRIPAAAGGGGATLPHRFLMLGVGI